MGLVLGDSLLQAALGTATHAVEGSLSSNDPVLLPVVCGFQLHAS